MNPSSRAARACFFAVLLLAAAPAMRAQTVVMPQIVDGGGWQTTIVVSNNTASTAAAALSFFQETTGGATQSWNLPLLESVSLQNLSLPGGGTIFLHTPGTAAANSQGWGSLQASSGVVCYAIYTYRTAGHQDQDATAPGVASAGRILVPYDNTNGLVTAIAIVNPTAASETISVSFQSESGAILTGSLPTLPPNGHSAFVLPTQFPRTAGDHGLAEFSSATGSLSIIALRANPTLAFTSAPVYNQSGAPIIGALPSAVAAFSSLTASVTFAPAGSSPSTLTIKLTPDKGASTYTAVLPSSTTFLSGAVSNQGQTFTFDMLSPDGDIFAPTGGSQLNATGGTLTFTLAQKSVQGGQATGTISGNLSITGAVVLVGSVTVSGPITGTYTATLQ
ncbi:MAG TPA: hypothetical protein VKT49_04210 [Bryobacteraceae bacterium]|nr:hypothetical protein [Bryobacteraceae bacterium]